MTMTMALMCLLMMMLSPLLQLNIFVTSNGNGKKYMREMRNQRASISSFSICHDAGNVICDGQFSWNGVRHSKISSTNTQKVCFTEEFFYDLICQKIK